jgi:predicted O-methyltransferase YrrM
MGKLNHEWVKASLEMADNERSKITEREREMHGLTSVRLKCLLNNLCAADSVNYLEIGCYKGASLIAALRGNDITAVGVDNFKYDDREPNKWAPEGYIWDNMKSQLESNLNTYRLQPDVINGDKIKIIEGDFQKTELPANKFNVCFFDISPVDGASYEEFFEHVFPSLTQTSVVIFSQQSNHVHANQLNDAITKYAGKVNAQYNEKRVSGSNADASKYYSGIRVFGFVKKAVSKTAPKALNNTQVKND